MNISVVLRHLMTLHNIGENELERLSEVTQPTIHRILSGESISPRDSNVGKIAKYFNVSNAQLRGEEPLPDSKDKGFLTIDVNLLKQCLCAVLDTSKEINKDIATSALVNYSLILYDDPDDLSKPDKIKKHLELLVN